MKNLKIVIFPEIAISASAAPGPKGPLNPESEPRPGCPVIPGSRQIQQGICLEPGKPTTDLLGDRLFAATPKKVFVCPQECRPRRVT